MCGLILAPAKYPESRIRLALEEMGYRGADGRVGVLSTSEWVLGHVQLAIQDLSEASQQPVRFPSGGLAFVGEIFNPGEGLTELEFLKNVVTTESYKQLHQVDGFWSIASILGSRAFAITDYLGTKPLYYWEEYRIVCSELSPMFQLEPPPPLDEVYLSNCIKFGYDYSGRTPYQGIRQLPPGAVVSLHNNRMLTYWDWGRVPTNPTNLRREIQGALQNRLIGQREVGVLVSGGLDSSIVYYTLQELGANVRAFSIENGESEFLPDGVEFLPSEVLPSLSEAVKIMQAPLDLGSLLPQVALARALSDKGLHVCLTGDGADELFGGYRRSLDYDSQASDIFCELPFYHLPRLDRVMMRETIELRSPFISPQVIASALALPRGLRTGKQVLKAEYAGLVPDRILNRVKLPLKSQAVKLGGHHYRAKLVEEFRSHVQTDF